jgi:tRNA modification GTPase
VTSAIARDTIVAIATPPGRGALAIVRVSGPDALKVCTSMVRPWPAEPRHATHARVHDAHGSPLDDVVVVWFRAPHSFTGEDVVEVTCHGGAIAPASIAATFVGAGARPATPGEFTRRAVMHGRLDVLQAEAVGDLIDSATTAAHRMSLAQLDGGLSRRITAMRHEILGLEALAAYDIDFPEEDDGPIPRERILTAADRVIGDIDALLATAPIGELVRRGAVVVIAGAPNVGKSSLFNALIGQRRAIVTAIPGTTRDAIEGVIDADGWPLRLVDTAGLRESSDTVEQMGIEISRDYIGRADVVLACGDSVDAVERVRAAVVSLTTAPAITVRTKADLAPAGSRRDDGAAEWVSAETGVGLRELVRVIAARLESAKGALTFDAPVLTHERHRIALAQARDEMLSFRSVFAGGRVPVIVAAVHLREAVRVLESLIGAVDVEDVLDRVFSSFCVGK